MKNDMLKDDSAQFIILSSFVVAVGLVILLVFLNQSFSAGMSSAESIMSFPKNDIREFRAETVNETFYLACNENSVVALNGQQRYNNFNTSFNRYIDNVKDLYAEKGGYVNVWYYCMVNDSILDKYQTLDNVTLWMYFNNGETRFNETYMVNIIR
jgi:hypothetical protein